MVLTHVQTAEERAACRLMDPARFEACEAARGAELRGEVSREDAVACSRRVEEMRRSTAIGQLTT